MLKSVVKASDEQSLRIDAEVVESELGVTPEEFCSLVSSIRRELSTFGPVDALPFSRFGPHCFERDPRTTAPVIMRFLDEDSILIRTEFADWLVARRVVRARIDVLFGRSEKSEKWSELVPWRYESQAPLEDCPEPRLAKVSGIFGIFCNPALVDRGFDSHFWPAEFSDAVELDGVAWEQACP